MRHRGEVLGDVGLEHVDAARLALDGAQHGLRPIGAGMGALARPAGIAVMDEAALPDRLDRLDQGVLDDPVLQRQRRDRALLGFEHLEVPVGAGAVGARQQAFLQRDQVGLEVALEAQHIGLRPPAPDHPAPGAVQRLKIRDLLEEVVVGAGHHATSARMGRPARRVAHALLSRPGLFMFSGTWPRDTGPFEGALDGAP